MKTKLLRRYSQPHLAYIHKATLAEYGIESYIFGEHFIGTVPAFSGLLNAGVELRVREEDYKEAIKYIEPENISSQVCANCGSENIYFSYGKKGFTSWFFALLSAIAGEPFGNIKRHYYCKDCGFKNAD